MSAAPRHPPAGEFTLPTLYEALSHPVRLRMVTMLSEAGELNCTAFYSLGSKTRLSFHLAKLREAGITRTRIEGTQRFMSLRAEDLNQRFPGWLAAVTRSAISEAAPRRKSRQA